jgi:hypothetical protein
MKWRLFINVCAKEKDTKPKTTHNGAKKYECEVVETAPQTPRIMPAQYHLQIVSYVHILRKKVKNNLLNYHDPLVAAHGDRSCGATT